ncbi:hypothetical protein B6S12_08505 [Helicobacter valdiviensis]|uniref:Mechanosensitive ion channel family protein n=1 Tax=Helicobacter valdiviensis TaxID=1458358 RepID=A0A2W6MSL0_9HELI|nr:mechanosensitive ion channel domain-containing protein [Helicobacter valdiviensis]PZT47544.1 hypothetical protein B6S12_08505 [Helicobacter valdiviensis]
MKFFIKFLAFSFIFLGLLKAEVFSNDLKQIKLLDEKISKINLFLNNPNNVWMKKYSNYVAYKQIIYSLNKTQNEITQLENRHLNIEEQNHLSNLQRNLNTLKRQRELLSPYKDAPFSELIQPHDLKDIPSVTNPILIIQAFSYIKLINQEQERLERNFADLENNLKQLKDKDTLLKELLIFYTNAEYTQKISQICTKDYCLFNKEADIRLAIKENILALEELQSAKNIFNTTLEIFTKNRDENISNLKEQIKNQIIKGAYIGFSILFLFVFALFVKIGVKKYIHDNERIYTTNKIINFLNITLVILILLFAYLDNVTYLVTVLGFASAGLAIAMKDWFMSLLGWIVIVVGGAVHVGDRIKVIKEGATYLGDVLDISILRITMYEDITLTSYMENRRAGRIVFIPNNFIFTTMFSNYSHGGLKTVWDGIDFTITFQSDHAKACHIARECAKKYAKGYTESTKKQFNKMRDKFSLKNTNVEPRVFSLLEPNGIRISVWYLTNAYATLALRSSISAEIIDAILKEPNITIAYPSTTVYSGGDILPKTDGIIPPIS